MIDAVIQSLAVEESKAITTEKPRRAELPAQLRELMVVVYLLVSFLGKKKLWIIFNVMDWTSYEYE